MFRSCVDFQWVKRILVAGVISVALGGCGGGGGGGGGGAGVPPGSGGTGDGGTPTSKPFPKPPATALNMTINSVTLPPNSSSPPVLAVVQFTVTNEKGERFTGLLPADLRFNIAKLTPGTGGNPSRWQNYVNSTRQNTAKTVTAMRGNVETPKLYALDGSPDVATAGTLVDHGDGTYTYTYYTDLSDVSVTCPAPCVDAQGNALDTTYDATLTHRVGIYTRSPLPTVNGIKDVRPSDGATSNLFSREIVTTAKCNECHNKLNVHGGRIDTQLCATCHNPGSWEANTGNTVDFKVYIHKIHRGTSLPSTVAGTPYMIGTDDFSDVVFPQEIRNCTKCHDGTVGALNATAEGDNWKTGLSRAACGSCHDNINFLVSGQATYTATPIAQRTGHSGGVMTDDSQCSTCHVVGGFAGSVAAVHNNTEAGVFMAKVQRAKFQFNIIEICGTAVAANPVCAPGVTPTVKFSVTDPTGATTHGHGNAYKLFPDASAADPEFWDTGTAKAVGSMSVDIAWDTRDYNNTGGYAARPARANQVNVFGAAAATNYGFASVQLPLYPKATDNGDGTYTVTALGPIPDGTVFPNVAATGSGAVAIEGRATADPLSTIPATTARLRIPIKGEVAYFRITDTTPVARRVAVDAITKCDNCHDQLSLHGGSRNDNVQLCVLCHNPNNTDAPASARIKFANGLSTGVAAAGKPDDGKKEEAIDFKRMIHGIHAGGATSLDGSTTLNGFRTKGIMVSGTDFSDVRFPGILNDCTTCHNTGTYELKGIWETPTQNHILASTVDSTPGLTSSNTSTEVNNALKNPGDDYNISPIAAVCSSCHDSDVQKSHMRDQGALFGDDLGNSIQSLIPDVGESCPVCHGPNTLLDVKVVHNVP